MIILSYNDTKNLSFDAVSVVGDFNRYNRNANPLHKKNNIWSTELKLSKGKYKYRFFVYDGLLINDPTAGIYECDESNEIWSIMIIDSKGNRVLPKGTCNIGLENYHLSNIASSFVFARHERRNVFDVLNDIRAVTSFEFSTLNSIHSATILWFEPNGDLFLSDDIKIESDTENEIAQVHFWLDIKRLKPQLGMWKLVLLIDGQFILEDIFFIKNYLLENNYGITV